MQPASSAAPRFSPNRCTSSMSTSPICNGSHGLSHVRQRKGRPTADHLPVRQLEESLGLERRASTSPKKRMPPWSLCLRVRASNFSGVMQMMSAASRSARSSLSPVSSRHVRPSAPPNRFCQSVVRSCASKFCRS